MFLKENWDAYTVWDNDFWQLWNRNTGTDSNFPIYIMNLYIPSIAPTATSVTITWSINVWSTLTWTYTFNDQNDEDIENGSIFQWYRSTTINWTYYAVTWAIQQSYTISSSDENTYLKFEITPRSDHIPYTWTTVISEWFWIGWLWIDSDAPYSWSLVINNWSWYTTSWNVILRITCANESVWARSLPISYAFWNTTDPINWATCTWWSLFDVDHILSLWNWDKTIYLRFKDAADNVGDNITGSILFDDMAPIWWNFSINSNESTTNNSWVILNITCPTDTYSNPSQYAFWDTANPNNWSTCSWSISTGSTLDNSTESEKIIYVNFRDSIWNIGNEITRSIIYDVTAPTWGLVSNIDWYQNNLSINITIDRGSWWISLMSEENSDYQLTYQNATLSWWTCWIFSVMTWAWVNEISTSTGYIFTATDWNCYKFQYTVKDMAWNSTTYTGTSVAMVSSEDPKINCYFEEVTNPEYQEITIPTHIYYNSNQSWSFRLNVTASASIIWIKSISFPDIWSWFNWSWSCFSWSCSQLYSWDAWALSTWTKNVIVNANNDNIASCYFELFNDSLAPWSWSISYITDYRNMLIMLPTMSVDNWLDNSWWAWIDFDSLALLRNTWTLSWNICNYSWSFVQISYTWSLPNISDNSSISWWSCYQYNWSVKDNVWNEVIYSDDDLSEYKVDTSIPITYVDNMTWSNINIFYNSWNKELFYKTTLATKDFSIRTFAHDPESEMNQILFPYISNWFSNSWIVAWSTGQYFYNYSYDINSWTVVTTWTKEVVWINNAMLSEAWVFFITNDNDVPIWVSINCNNDYNNNWTYEINWSYWTDQLSWLNASASYIQLSTWTLAWNMCTSTLSFVNIWTQQETNLSQNWNINWCYIYRYHSVDNVWNETYTDSCTVKVDTTAPSKPILSITENSDYIYATWTILYYNNQISSTQTFDIIWSASDIDTGLEIVSWENEFWDTPSDSTWNFILNYSIDSWQACSWSNIYVTVANYAGFQNSSNVTCRLDINGPIDWSVTNTDWFEEAGSTSVTINNWYDLDSYMSYYSSDYLLELSTWALIQWYCWSFWSWVSAWVTETPTTTWYLVTSNEATCYKFRYFNRDIVYNQSVFTWSSIAKISPKNPEVMTISN